MLKLACKLDDRKQNGGNYLQLMFCGSKAYIHNFRNLGYVSVP